MTPAARYAAAIDILEGIIAGDPAERALTGWARQNRFAGSKDRAAIRDHVFDALRARRSLSALGGAESGRGLILGLLRREGVDPQSIFGSGGYAPPALSEAELARGRDPAPGAEASDLPDWLWPQWTASLGDHAEAAARVLQERAPVALRVNLRRASRATAQEALAAEGIETTLATVPTGMILTQHPRRIAQSAAFQDGWVELQDVASQLAVAALPIAAGSRVLDYCAGGGGKALAIADQADTTVMAHDVAPERMRDLPSRAARAGVSITQLRTAELASAAPFDLVLCDAPCSGSGTWRRTPDAKWRLTPDRLADYQRMQREVLEGAAPLVAESGVLAYATCSVLNDENAETVAAFCKAHPEWSARILLKLQPTAEHDGFYLALLERAV